MPRAPLSRRAAGSVAAGTFDTAYPTTAMRKERSLPDGLANGQVDPEHAFLVGPCTDGMLHNRTQNDCKFGVCEVARADRGMGGLGGTSPFRETHLIDLARQ